jgi:hypothetical protein
MLVLSRSTFRSDRDDLKDRGGPLRAIMRQPVFVVAAFLAMLGYGIMNLMMTSTPLAMRAHDHHFNDAAVRARVEYHRMYGPFVLYRLARSNRFGVLQVIPCAHRAVVFRDRRSAAGTGLVHFLDVPLPAGRGLELHVRGRSALLSECPHSRRSAQDPGANDF